jgi:hypothetical protein
LFPDCIWRLSLFLIFNKIPVGALKPLLFHKKKKLSPTAMALLDTLLVIKPSARGMVGSALDSEDQAIVV